MAKRRCFCSLFAIRRLLGRRGGAYLWRRRRGANEIGSSPPGETAGEETKPSHAAAEAVVVDLHEVEARLEREAFERGAPVLALHPEGPGRQVDVAHCPGTAEADDAHHGAVVLDAAAPGRTLETAERVKLAGDETLGLVGPHFAGPSREGGKGAGPRAGPTGTAAG